MGQLVSLCLSGHGAEHSGFWPAWCGDRRAVRAARVGVDIGGCAPGTLHPAGVTSQPPAQVSQGVQGLVLWLLANGQPW